MKKNNYLLLILVIACCSTARAQEQPPKQHQPHQMAPPLRRWSLGLAGGAAFPVGEFAHTADQGVQSGTVHTGGLFELSGTYHVNQSWGITLLAGEQYNKSDVHYVLVPGPLGTNMNETIPPQHWSMTRILAGGAYTIPLNRKKNLAVLVHALAGIQKTHVSEYSYTMHFQDYYALFPSLPARNLAWAFAYQADAGLQWKVGRRWSLLASAGYAGSRSSYNLDITALLEPVADLIPNAPHTYKKIYFPTGSVLLTAGVGFEL